MIAVAGHRNVPQDARRRSVIACSLRKPPRASLSPSLAGYAYRARAPTDGYAATREEAMAAFEKAGGENDRRSSRVAPRRASSASTYLARRVAPCSQCDWTLFSQCPL